jgi:hypothetical protein
VIVTGHRALDYDRVVQRAAQVVDACNATAGVVEGRERIVRLGAV